MATYEIWLADDAGKRITLLKDLFFLNYTRTIRGLGTLSFGMAFETLAEKVNPFFLPDWRVEVWRSAGYGIPL